jgi:peptide/nickel transport system substrate-binding protein
MAALRTGKIDLMASLSWQQANILDKTSPELKKQAIPASSSTVAFRNDNEPFTDINVRKAMQLAIDRETIAKTYYGGIVDGTPSGFISKALKGYCFAYEDWPQSLKDEYSYNPERARELLAEAGYPNGFKTECVADTTRDIQLLQVMQSMFADIGVTMDITPMDRTAFSSFTSAGKHQQLSTQEGGFTWPPTRFISQYYSKGRDAIITGVNDPGYDAINDAFWAATTRAEATEACREADRYALEKHWEVSAVETVKYTYWQPYLEGYAGDTHAGFWGQAYLWARMWVDQHKKESMGR